MTPDDVDAVKREAADAPRGRTAMVMRLGDAAPHADQLGRLQGIIALLTSPPKVDVRGDGTIVVIWAEAKRAAATALEIREALPTTRIALATGGDELDALIARGAGLLVEDNTGIRVDDATAMLIEPGFELQLGTDGTHVMLVAQLASGTPALVDKVIGNYKIVRLLGTGGMGVVYLAEHVSLGRKAVIKFVQDRLSTRGEYAQRFFTEAKTAASIHHPGIVDVFDYGHDDRGRGYIVMEYLDGESLRTRLRRDKPLPFELAISIATQIASAVAAAHAAGVIHRDLKPDNIFLVADPETKSRVRAKVLDFGLAKATQQQGGADLTQTGAFVGTPLYSSPEQCRSTADVDHRTDIYSLGCIVFEMICGRPPFVDKSVGDLVIAHNTTQPPSPTSLQISVSPALEQAILRALAKAPSDRFASMTEFAAALAGAPGHDPLAETALARPKAAAVPRRKTGLIVAAAAGGAAVAAIVAVVLLRSGKPTPAPPGSHRSIAVLDLGNASGRTDAAWVATALGEVVRTDLRANLQLAVVPGDQIAHMVVDLGVRDADDWTRDRLAKVRDDIGADVVIAGSYVDTAGELRVETRLYETAGGALIAQTSATGAESDLLELGARVAADVQRELGVADDGTVATATPGTVLPKRAGAARFYAEGLAKFRRFELVEARDLLTRATADSPDDPLIHSALAATWSKLGYEAKAAAEAKLAFDHSATLPRENRLAVEAQYRQSTAQWDKAVTAYRTLFEFFPNRLDYGLALAAAETRAGDAKSAYGTLETLRKLPAPLGSDPQIELAEAEAAAAADDIERERVHAERAAGLARKRGARLLLANARLLEGWTLWELGRDAEAAPAYDEAKRIFTDLGDRSGVARCLNNIALAMHRNHKDADAATAFEEALRITKEIGDTTVQAWVLNNWAYMLADAGELAKARELNQQKLELGGERGDSADSQAAAHANLAEITRWQGDLVAARQHCETADALLRGIDARRFAAYTADQFAELLRAEDDLPGARRQLDKALHWASDSKQPAETAEIRVSHARVERDAGQLAEAETLARTAIDDLRVVNETSVQVCAVAVLATILVERDRATDAAHELAAIASLPAEGTSFACRLEADIARARVTGRDPARRADALAALRDARARADRAGFVQLQLEIRLAAAQLEGNRAELQALARDAAAKRFQLIARLASAK